jgi:tRNA(Ile)-lysidine synthase
VRRELDADRIAIGHHADDQAETVLFRIMRGTGVRGLAGIPMRRGPVVRPLLGARHGEILEYLERRDIEWIADPSNSDTRWARARIRASVLPALQVHGEDAVGRLLALSKVASAAEALLETITDDLVTRTTVGSRTRWADPGRVVLDRDLLLAAGGELTARIVRRVVLSFGHRLTVGGTRAGVEFISRGRSGGRVAVGRGVELAREYDRITVSWAAQSQACSELVISRAVPGAGALRIGGRDIALRWRPAGAASRVPGRIAVPVPLGHYPLSLREWRAGDRIRLAGGTRKLKKLFNERRVPVGERSRVPVLVDAHGSVLWVAGLAVATANWGAEYEKSLMEFELRDE